MRSISALFRVARVALLLPLVGAVTLLAQQGAPGLITNQDILDGLKEDGRNWLTFGGNYANHRFSPLTQITPDNVAKLQPQWTFQTNTLGNFETTTLVRDNVLYVTGPQNVAWAVDARSGRQIWRYRRELPATGLTACCGLVNRGFAALGDKLFMTTLDAHLLALDMKTGAIVWDATLEDYKTGYASTIAPIIVKDKVIVGVAGGEYGIRGFIDAYEANTGKRAWRFYTIPGPGEPGFNTWQGDSWKIGGTGVWVTGAYDPETNSLFYGTGNPGPDYHSESREGDNLYSCSLVVLDADTGKLKWHYQFTPHDELDYDSTQVPVLADIQWQGRPRKVMLWANRNGVMYVLDRRTGEFLKGKPYVKVNWMDGFDSKGRPRRVPGKVPTPEGTLIQPHVHGATNWQPASFSPHTGLFYVAHFENSATIVTEGLSPRAAGINNRATTMGQVNLQPFYNTLDEAYGVVRAYDPATLEPKWEFKMADITWAGVLTTASDLVFSGGKEGYFFALDARSGQLLWKAALGGQVNSGPMSYAVNGRQYVSVAAGSALFSFALRP